MDSEFELYATLPGLSDWIAILPQGTLKDALLKISTPNSPESACEEALELLETFLSGLGLSK